MGKSKINKKGIVLISAVFITIIFLITFDIEQSGLQTSSAKQQIENLNQNTDIEITNLEAQIEDGGQVSIENYCLVNPEDETCLEIERLLDQQLLDFVRIVEQDNAIPPIENVLEFLGFTDTFGIRSNIIITDSIGNQIKGTSDIFTAPTLIDETGSTFDLGNIEMEFIGVTNPKDAVIQVSGFIDIEYAGIKIETKQIFFNGDTTEHKAVLNVADSSNVPFSERDEKYIFQFSKLESNLQPHNSVNSLQVIIRDLNVEINDSGTISKYELEEDSILYSLDLQTDQSRLIVLDSENNVIEIPRSDGILRTCSYGVNTRHSGQIRTTAPMAVVKLAETGEEIATIPSHKGGVPKLHHGAIYCQEVSNIPRDTNILITIGTRSYDVITSVNQPYLGIIYYPNQPYSEFNKGNIPPNVAQNIDLEQKEAFDANQVPPINCNYCGL